MQNSSLKFKKAVCHLYLRDIIFAGLLRTRNKFFHFMSKHENRYIQKF